MKYHMIVNHCFGDIKKQISELNGFVEQSEIQGEKGNTFIICGGQQDGDDKQKLAELGPTKSVVFIIVDHYDPEVILGYLETRVSLEDLYLFGSNYFGAEIAVRLGKRLGGSSLNNCIKMTAEDGAVTAEKMVYSNHMKGVFELQRCPFCIAVAKGQEEVFSEDNKERIIEIVDLRKEPLKDGVLDWQYTPTDQDSGLSEASFVVVAGRGARKKETSDILADLARTMGAEFGASRPVVMNAWAPMEELVGVSGVMLKPEVCIVAGASGAPALYAGIEKSKYIVAVNSDENAPIIKKSDVAIIGDCKEVLGELARQMGEEEDG